MSKIQNSSLRKLPSVQSLLSDAEVSSLPMDEKYVKVIAQQVMDKFRSKIAGGLYLNLQREELFRNIKQTLMDEVTTLQKLTMQRVINATGVILHTNLGRAPIARSATIHLQEILENYTNIEVDLQSGKRSNRIEIVEKLICLITGAEEALVVNNNAAAIFLALNSLCFGKEVPVSHGELVEIGGSFRMPEVMKSSGCKMHSVGTTNKTHLQDYQNAIQPKSGALLKVHTSNYRVMGFVESVDIRDLVKLAHSAGLPLIYDMGSGVIEGLETWGYPHEPITREYVDAGVDVITISGDKVFGGPQAGIILGRKKYIRKIKKNHLLRALRCDKISYALLEATLQLYLRPAQLSDRLPVVKMLNTGLPELRDRAERIRAAVLSNSIQVELIEADAQMGSGALPLEKIPSFAISLKPEKMSVSRLAKLMRQAKPPVVGYIENDRYLLNMRTIRDDEIDSIIAAIQKSIA